MDLENGVIAITEGLKNDGMRNLAEVSRQLQDLLGSVPEFPDTSSDVQQKSYQAIKLLAVLAKQADTVRPAEAAQLVAVVKICLDWAKLYTGPKKDPITLEKFLYHISLCLIKQKHISEALQMGAFLQERFEVLFHFSSTSCQSALKTVAAGMYVKFWNTAFQLEQANNNPSVIYQLCLQALLFSLFTDKEISSLPDKVEATLNKADSFIKVARGANASALEELYTCFSHLSELLKKNHGSTCESGELNSCGQLVVIDLYILLVRFFIRHDKVDTVKRLTDDLQLHVSDSWHRDHILCVELIQTAAMLSFQLTCQNKKKVVTTGLFKILDKVHRSLETQLQKATNLKYVQTLTNAVLLTVTQVSGEAARTNSRACFLTFAVDLQAGILALYADLGQLYNRQIILQNPKESDADKAHKKLQSLTRKATWWRTEKLQLELERVKGKPAGLKSSSSLQKLYIELQTLGRDIETGFSASPPLAQEKDRFHLGNLAGRFGQVAYQGGFYEPAIDFMATACRYLSLYCEKDKTGCKASEVQLAKKYEYLSEMQRRRGLYENALISIADGLLADASHLTPAVEQWVHIKYDMSVSESGKSSELLYKSMSSYLSGNTKIPIRMEPFTMLDLELKALQDRPHTFDLQCSVVEDMNNVASTTHEKALVLLNKVQVCWAMRQDMGELPKMCQECLDLLNPVKEQPKEAAQYDIVRAKALVWSYILSDTDPLQLRGTCMKDKGSKPQDTNQSDMQDDLSLSENQDVSAATVAMEMNSHAPLEEALGLFERFMSSVSGKMERGVCQEVLDYVSVISSIYCLAVKPLWQLRALFLQKKLAVHNDNLELSIRTSSMMAHAWLQLGHPIKATEVINVTDEEVGTESVRDGKVTSSYGYICYLVTKSETHLMMGQVKKAYLVYKKASDLLDTNYKLKNKESLRLKASIKRLLSKILSTQSTELPETFNKGEPLAVSIEACRAQGCLANSVLGGWVLSGSSISDKVPDNTLTKWGILTDLLECLMQAGIMFVELGEPREAKCYLRQAQKISQAFNLPRWASLCHLSLGRLECLSARLMECESRLHSTQYLLTSVVATPDESTYNKTSENQRKSSKDGRQRRSGSSARNLSLKEHDVLSCFGFADVDDSGDADLIHTVPLDLDEESEEKADGTASPVFTQKKLPQPEFLDHKKTCVCDLCRDTQMHLLWIQHSLLHAQLLQQKGDTEQALKSITSLQLVVNVIQSKGSAVVQEALKMTGEKVSKAKGLSKRNGKTEDRSDPFSWLVACRCLASIQQCELLLQMRDLDAAKSQAHNAVALTEKHPASTWIHNKAWLLYLECLTAEVLPAPDDTPVNDLSLSFAHISLGGEELHKKRNVCVTSPAQRTQSIKHKQSKVRKEQALRLKSGDSVITPQSPGLMKPAKDVQTPSKTHYQTVLKDRNMAMESPIPGRSEQNVPQKFKGAPKGIKTVRKTRQHLEPEEPSSNTSGLKSKKRSNRKGSRKQSDLDSTENHTSSLDRSGAFSYNDTTANIAGLNTPVAGDRKSGRAEVDTFDDDSFLTSPLVFKKTSRKTPASAFSKQASKIFDSDSDNEVTAPLKKSTVKRGTKKGVTSTCNKTNETSKDKETKCLFDGSLSSKMNLKQPLHVQNSRKLLQVHDLNSSFTKSPNKPSVSENVYDFDEPDTEKIGGKRKTAATKGKGRGRSHSKRQVKSQAPDIELVRAETEADHSSAPFTPSSHRMPLSVRSKPQKPKSVQERLNVRGVTVLQDHQGADNLGSTRGRRSRVTRSKVADIEDCRAESSPDKPLDISIDTSFQDEADGGVSPPVLLVDDKAENSWPLFETCVKETQRRESRLKDYNLDERVCDSDSNLSNSVLSDNYDNLEPIEMPRSDPNADADTKRTGRGTTSRRGRKVDDTEITRSMSRCSLEGVSERVPDVSANCSLSASLITTPGSMKSQLEQAFSMIQRCPQPVLYRQICQALAVSCVGSHPDQAAFYFSESQAVTFRHYALVNISRKIRKLQKEGSTNNAEAVVVDLEKMNLDGQQTEVLNKTKDFLSFGKSQDDFRQLVNTIPEDLTVCHVSAVTSVIGPGSMYVTQYRSGESPVIAHLPGYSTKQGQSILSGFDDIMMKCKQSMGVTDKVKWWTQRQELNQRLEELLDDADTHWLGSYKVLFLGKLQNKDDHLKLQAAVQAVQGCCEKLGDGCEHVDTRLLEAVLAGYHMLTKAQVLTLLQRATSLPPASDSLTAVHQQLQKQAKQLNLAVCRRHPLVLILDKHVQHLPWESIPSLSDQAICRQPSLHFMAAHLHTLTTDTESVYNKGVRLSRTFYLLNPDNNLPTSQTKFQDWFKSEKTWRGIIGRMPSSEEYTEAVTNHDLFIYCGHGSGSKYLSGDTLQMLRCRAVTLLMGCSSGRLVAEGQLEAMGMMLYYFLAGCPCIVANLWDVTDRDIDRFLEELLKSWTTKKQGSSLLDALPGSREVCRLPHLIGAAPVVYGLPVNLVS